MNKLHFKNIIIFFLCQIYAKSGNLILLSISALAGYSLFENRGFATVPIAMQYLGVVAGSFLASYFMRFAGRKKGFVLGGIIGIVGAVGASISLLHKDVFLFCFFTFLIGIYNSFGMLYRFAVTDSTPDQYKSTAISYVLFGGLVAAFLGAWLATKGQGMFMTSVYSGGYMLVALMALLTVFTVNYIKIPHVKYLNGNDSIRSLRDIISQKNLMLAMTSAALIHTTHNFVITLTPLFMADGGYTYNDMSEVVKYHILAMFTPSFFTGNLIKKIGEKKVFCFGLLFMFTALVFAIDPNSFLKISLSVVFLGLAWNFIYVSSTSMVTKNHTSNEKERIQMMNEVVVFSTVAVLSFSSGILYNWYEWKSVISILVIVLILLSSILFWSKNAENMEV